MEIYSSNQLHVNHQRSAPTVPCSRWDIVRSRLDHALRRNTNLTYSASTEDWADSGCETDAKTELGMLFQSMFGVVPSWLFTPEMQQSDGTGRVTDFFNQHSGSGPLNPV